MKYEINHPQLQINKLTVEYPSFWSPMVFRYNGAPVELIKNKATLRGDNGNDLEMLTKPNVWNSLPKLTIDQQEIKIGKKPLWFEMILIGLPFSLVAVGGAVGGGVGAGATFINSRIYRFIPNKTKAYALMLLTTIISTIAFFVIAVAINTLLAQYRS